MRGPVTIERDTLSHSTVAWLRIQRLCATSSCASCSSCQTTTTHGHLRMGNIQSGSTLARTTGALDAFVAELTPDIVYEKRSVVIAHVVRA